MQEIKQLGRNHEVTILKLKHIRFKEKYAEGDRMFSKKNQWIIIKK